MGGSRSSQSLSPSSLWKPNTTHKQCSYSQKENCGFDVASLSEMKSVLEAGTNPDKILYAQPYKQPSHLLFAMQHDILSVCDSVDEIVKVGDIAALHNHLHPRILIRILPDEQEGDTQASLSCKFGAPLKTLPALVQAAQQGNVTVVGVSFHVGSHCHSAIPYQNTLKLSRVWWNSLEKELQCPLSVLDIGGGYPGESGTDFCNMARLINSSIGETYGDISERVRIIAEPGRYMVTSSMFVVASVIAEKQPNEYVLNTGVYGGLSHSMWDKRAARSSIPYIVKEGHSEDHDTCNSEDHDTCNSTEVVLWGPTCDSSDKLVPGYHLKGLRRGDWVVFPDLGAYGHNIMTTFNGFPHPRTFYVRSELKWGNVRKMTSVAKVWQYSMKNSSFKYNMNFIIDY